MKRILFALAGLFLAGCASLDEDLTPPQQAYALNKEYQAVAHVAFGYLQSPAASAKAKEAIQAADQVAFDYVEQTTQQARAWQAAAAAPAAAAVEQGIFSRLFERARAAVATLGGLLPSAYPEPGEAVDPAFLPVTPD